MDFYILLGVEREASDAEIKRAYRRLARRFHPDINPGDRDAEARFRQILIAYETLIDPNRRRIYDAGEAAGPVETASAFGFTGFDFSTAAHAYRATTFGELFEEVFTRRGDRDRASQPDRGADLHVTAHVSFEQAWHGVDWPVTVTRHDTCVACAGSGYHRTADTQCLSCDGTGVVRSVRGHMVFSKNCPRCSGTGRLRQLVCATCHGQGVEMRTEALTVRVPAGMSDGGRIRVAGKGHAGLNGGPSGDLYVEVTVAPHPVFQRVGDEVHVTVPVAIDEAALGARIEVPTPDGMGRLRIPSGTQSGQRFRLRERGVPSPRGGPRGDLVVEVRLMLPKVLDERSKELLREFGRINAQEVRELRTQNEERRPKP